MICSAVCFTKHLPFLYGHSHQDKAQQGYYGHNPFLRMEEEDAPSSSNSATSKKSRRNMQISHSMSSHSLEEDVIPQQLISDALRVWEGSSTRCWGLPVTISRISAVTIDAHLFSLLMPC